MWSVARCDLGLSDEQFWRLTPRLWAALVARYEEQQDRDDWRCGQIAAIIANSNRNAKTRPQPFSVEEFMLRKSSRGPGARKSSPESMLTFLKQFASAHNAALADAHVPEQKPKRKSKRG